MSTSAALGTRMEEEPTTWAVMAPSSALPDVTVSSSIDVRPGRIASGRTASALSILPRSIATAEGAMRRARPRSPRSRWQPGTCCRPTPRGLDARQQLRIGVEQRQQHVEQRALRHGCLALRPKDHCDLAEQAVVHEQQAAAQVLRGRGAGAYTSAVGGAAASAAVEAPAITRAVAAMPHASPRRPFSAVMPAPASVWVLPPVPSRRSRLDSTLASGPVFCSGSGLLRPVVDLGLHALDRGRQLDRQREAAALARLHEPGADQLVELNRTAASSTSRPARRG